ncbi:MAG TPA: hypothetical protein VGE21_13470 [Flavobacteriales bacterium]
MSILPPAPLPQLVPGDPKIVGLTAYDRYRLDFAEHFRTTGSMNALLGQVQAIPWPQLLALWPSAPKYLAIHYGLVSYTDGTSGATAWIMRYGISGHGDDGRGNYVPPIAPFYMPEVEWNGTSFVPAVPDVVGQWPAGEAYQDKMRVARTDVDQGFVALDADDARVCIFPFGRVEALLTDNRATAAESLLEISTITRSYNASDGGHAGFRHGICLCLLKQVGHVRERQLVNDTLSHPYEGKGADLGNLCPPICKAT